MQWPRCWSCVFLAMVNGNASISDESLHAYIARHTHARTLGHVSTVHTYACCRQQACPVHVVPHFTSHLVALCFANSQTVPLNQCIHPQACVLPRWQCCCKTLQAHTPCHLCHLTYCIANPGRLPALRCGPKQWIVSCSIPGTHAHRCDSACSVQLRQLEMPPAAATAAAALQPHCCCM